MVPHGDAEDRAHSGRIKDEIRLIVGSEEHVVGVLILNDDVVRNQARSLCESPTDRDVEALKT